MTIPNTNVSVAHSVRTHYIAFIHWKLIAAVLHLAVIWSLKLNFSSIWVPTYLMTLLLCTSTLFIFRCVVVHFAIWWPESMMINSVLPLLIFNHMLSIHFFTLDRRACMLAMHSSSSPSSVGVNDFFIAWSSVNPFKLIGLGSPSSDTSETVSEIDAAYDK